MINQVNKDLPELQPSRIYGVRERYQFARVGIPLKGLQLLKGDQGDLRTNSAAGIQAIVPVNDQYLVEKTSLLFPRDPLEKLKSGIVIIIFGALMRPLFPSDSFRPPWQQKMRGIHGHYLLSRRSPE